MFNYVFLDFETSGLHHEECQVIEIAAIKTDVYLQEIDRFETLVKLNEGVVLPEFITKLTGITEEDLLNGISEQEALAQLKEFMGNDILVAQNAPFEMAFLSRGGISPNLFYCTRYLSTYVEPELSASLKNVTQRHSVNLEGHHRAINDVLATIEVFDIMATKIQENEDIEDFLNVVMDEPERPLKFVPKTAVVKKIYKVGLDSRDILELIEGLEEESNLRGRLKQLVGRYF